MKRKTLATCAVLTAACLAGCENSEPPADRADPAGGLPGRGVGPDQIAALQVGMSMDEAVASIGYVGQTLSVPALMYDAQSGGKYYLAFFDLQTPPATARPEPCLLHGIIRFTGGGEGIWVLPAERAGEPFLLPTSYLRADRRVASLYY